MDQNQNEQTDGLSDHQKFGESSSFANASESSPDASGTPGATEVPQMSGTPDASEVYDKFAESAASVRERAVQMKTQLADKLETGAGRLRQRTTNTRKFDDAVATTKQRVVDTSDRLATGMERGADWLRNANMNSFQDDLGRQVRQNPGRTLLIAGAIGYLLGRAFKGKDA
ncbi:MAG: hypothetical protein ABI889_05675 [Gemmatimonadota bacterium]